MLSFLQACCKALKLSDSGERLSEKEILLFADELQTLLQAGLPLDKALQVLTDLTRDNARLSRIIQQILQAVKAGTSLADAMEQQSGIFSRFFLNMIRAGETGGNLADVLKRLAVYLESSQDLKNTVTTAMIYPAILLIMSLASLFVMLTFVVPQFSEMFESAGKALPLPTQIVVAIADFLQQWWWLLFLLVVVTVFYFKRQLADPETAFIWHNRLLRMPLMGKIILNKEIAALSRTLGTLLANGVSLLNALTIARDNNRHGVDRLSLVTSGHSVDPGTLEQLTTLYAHLARETSMEFCASMGFLTPETAETLRRLRRDTEKRRQTDGQTDRQKGTRLTPRQFTTVGQGDPEFERESQGRELYGKRAPQHTMAH